MLAQSFWSESAIVIRSDILCGGLVIQKYMIILDSLNLVFEIWFYSDFENT